MPTTTDKPHVLDFTLTLHGPDGTRLVGFDNPTRWRGKAEGRPKTTSTGCARSGHTTTRMLVRCWQRSGKKLNR